jgi:hypothetical protein
MVRYIRCLARASARHHGAHSSLRQKAAGSEGQAFHDEPVSMNFFAQSIAYKGVTTMIFSSWGEPKAQAHSARQES